MSNLHVVVFDQTLSGHLRYSCKSCNGRAVVRQPYMNNVQWQMARERFFTEHPDFVKGKVSGTCVYCGNVRNDLLLKEVEWFCPNCARFQNSVNDQLERDWARN